MHTLSVTVDDGRGGVRTVGFDIDVQTFHAGGAAAPAITVNTWPEIAEVRSDPTRVESGQATALSIQASMPIEEIDVPDAAGVDSDCDGIDGDLEVSFFVRPDGDDAGPGTIDQPFASIQHALGRAAADPGPAVPAAACPRAKPRACG